MVNEFCSCEKCKDCCLRLPGIPLPNDVIKIAEYLKMSVLDCLEKYFVVGYREGISIKGETYEEIMFVYPAIKGWNNKIETWAYPFNIDHMPCVFFKDGLCEINSVKPFECLKVFGCEKSNTQTLYHRNTVLLEWNNVWENNTIHPDIKKFIQSKKY